MEESERRLIIIAVESGQPLDIDFDGDFETWEVIGALEAAARLMHMEDIEAEGEQEEEA